MKKPLYLLLAFVILFNVSCGDMTKSLPDKDEIAPGKKLPIDGIYSLSTTETDAFKYGVKKGTDVEVNDDLIVRLERGRGYYVRNSVGSPGKVNLKEIRRMDKHTYKAIALIPNQKEGTDERGYNEYETTIYVSGQNLVVKYENPLNAPVSDRLFISTLYYTLIEKDVD